MKPATFVALAADRPPRGCTPSNADHDPDDDLYATGGDPDEDVADEFEDHFDDGIDARDDDQDDPGRSGVQERQVVT